MENHLSIFCCIVLLKISTKIPKKTIDELEKDSISLERPLQLFSQNLHLENRETMDKEDVC